MNDDEGRSSPGWLERLAQAFSGEPRDREAVVDVLRDSASRGIVSAASLNMLLGALAVDRLQVRDVMIPRAQMVMIEHDASLGEVLPIVVESGHSRFPVMGESRDQVIGLLLAKDLLRHVAQNGMAGFEIGDYLRPVAYIPESKRLDILLSEFRASRNHMAIVVDEYGGVAGLITIEDVLEQIVGEIDDEFDVEEELPIVEHGRRRWSVSALMPIEDFNKRFDTQYSDSEFDTVGGLVVNAIGRMPESGERVAIGDYEFRVLRADRRRVHLLEVTPVGEPVRTTNASRTAN